MKHAVGVCTYVQIATFAMCNFAQNIMRGTKPDILSPFNADEFYVPNVREKVLRKGNIIEALAIVIDSERDQYFDV